MYVRVVWHTGGTQVSVRSRTETGILVVVAALVLALVVRAGLEILSLAGLAWLDPSLESSYWLHTVLLPFFSVLLTVLYGALAFTGFMFIEAGRGRALPQGGRIWDRTRIALAVAVGVSVSFTALGLYVGYVYVGESGIVWVQRMRAVLDLILVLTSSLYVYWTATRLGTPAVRPVALSAVGSATISWALGRSGLLPSLGFGVSIGAALAGLVSLVLWLLAFLQIRGHAQVRPPPPLRTEVRA